MGVGGKNLKTITIIITIIIDIIITNISTITIVILYYHYTFKSWAEGLIGEGPAV